MRVMLLLAAWFGGACVGPAPAGGEAARPFVWGWTPGSVSIEESVERDGEVLTLTWNATIAAESGKLRMTFASPTLTEGIAEALGPNGSHPFFQVMPDVVFEAQTGRLIAVERVREALEANGRMGIKKKADERSLGVVKTQEDVDARARMRWAAWTRLVGFKHRQGTSEDKQKLKLEDGQEMPVVTTTTHSKDGGSSVVKVVRSFAGATVTKVYKQVLAATGAPAEVVAAVDRVIREEHYEATLDPATMRPARIRTRELTTEHSQGDRVQVRSAGETWTFVW
jgi:hypothetical protein